VGEGVTTYGSPPVFFQSSLSEQEKVYQTQLAGTYLDKTCRNEKTLMSIELANTLKQCTTDGTTNPDENKKVGRRQDIGKGDFWSYVLAILFIHALIPVALGSSYGFLFYIATVIFGEALHI